MTSQPNCARDFEALALQNGEPTDAEMRADAAALWIQPLFERDLSDTIESEALPH